MQGFFSHLASAAGVSVINDEGEKMIETPAALAISHWPVFFFYYKDFAEIFFTNLSPPPPHKSNGPPQSIVLVSSL